MNPEQQRIAIAEACGWKEIRAEVDWLPKELTGIFTWPHPTDAEKIKYFINRKPIPDFLNDLNAMHESEETLDASQCAEYARQLMKHHTTYCVTVLDNRFAPTEEIAYQTYQLLHATAAQRAEAFLRTIGKWEEAKP